MEKISSISIYAAIMVHYRTDRSVLPGLLFFIRKHPWTCGTCFAEYSLLHSFRSGNNIFEAFTRRAASVGHDQKKNGSAAMMSFTELGLWPFKSRAFNINPAGSNEVPDVIWLKHIADCYSGNRGMNEFIILEVDAYMRNAALRIEK